MRLRHTGTARRVTAVVLSAVMVVSVLAVGAAAGFTPDAGTATQTSAPAPADGPAGGDEDETVNGSADEASGGDGEDGLAQSSVEPQTQQGVQLRVLVPRRGDVSFGSNETVRIWVGAVNTTPNPPTPVANRTINVSISAPGGNETTQQVTTDASGKAVLTYDLEGRPDGFYQVSATSGQASGGGTGFQAGPQYDVFPGIGDTFLVNRNVTVAVQATNGVEPVVNSTVTVTVLRDNGTSLDPIVEKTLRTDAGGYVTVNFTPSSEAEYRVVAKQNGSVVARESYTARSRVSEVRIADDFLTETATVRIGGRIVNGASLYANENITVRIVRDPFGAETIVANLSTQTNAQGLFAVSWPTPDVNDSSVSYRVRLLNESGSRIPISGFGTEFFIQNREPDDVGPTEPEGLELDVEFDEFTTAPGRTINLSVTLTDNGTAVPNTAVTVQLGYNDFGIPIPVDRITLQTDANGQASTTISIPASAPAGEIEFQADAAATVDNTTIDGFDDAELEQFEYDDFARGTPRSGETHPFFFRITNRTSDGPVPGVTVMTTASLNALHSTVIDTGVNVTNADGEATIPISVPEGVSGEIAYGDRALTESRDTYSIDFANGFEVTVNEPSGEIAAGTNVTISYSANTSANVTAFVAVRTFSDAFIETSPVGEVLTPGENVTFEIPRTATTGTFYDVRVFAVSETGVVAEGNGFFRVDKEAPTAEIAVSPRRIDFESLPVGTNTTATVEVSNQGELNLTVTDTSVSGSAFTIVSGGGNYTLEPGESRTVTVRFAPGSPGQKNGRLTVTSDDPNDPTVSVSLAGTGTGVRGAAPFGNTTSPPTSSVSPELRNGTFRVEASVAANTSASVVSSSSGNYSVAINVSGNATNVTFYLRASAVEAVVGSLTNAQLKVDGQTQPFSVVTQNGTRYVAFTIANFSTRTVSFTQAVTSGDVTGDGTVNTGDVIQVQRFIVNLRTLSSSQFQAADVTGDGTVNTGDVIQIQRFIVGLRASL